MNLIKMECEVLDWNYLAQDKESVKVSCENGNELSGSIKYWEFVDYRGNY
jgi:hypothetical protein